MKFTEYVLDSGAVPDGSTKNIVGLMYYSNPWSGKSQFYKGKRKKLPTAETDQEYQDYCSRKKNKAKIMDYKSWCRSQRRKGGFF